MALYCADAITREIVQYPRYEYVYCRTRHRWSVARFGARDNCSRGMIFEKTVGFIF
jgi:hypothetical protein